MRKKRGCMCGGVSQVGGRRHHASTGPYTRQRHFSFGKRVLTSRVSGSPSLWFTIGIPQLLAQTRRGGHIRTAVAAERLVAIFFFRLSTLTRSHPNPTSADGSWAVAARQERPHLDPWLPSTLGSWRGQRRRSRACPSSTHLTQQSVFTGRLSHPTCHGLGGATRRRLARSTLSCFVSRILIICFSSMPQSRQHATNGPFPLATMERMETEP